jgi:quinol monooxygenase YgiN
MPMVIIAGHLEVDAAERDQYVAAHGDLVRRARQAPGCLAWRSPPTRWIRRA